MAKPSKDTTSITARIDSAILKELDILVADRVKERPGQTYTRTDALAEILPLGLKALQNPKALDVGIIVLNHIDKIEDPMLVAELKAQLRERQIVDYVASLTPDQLDALATIVFDEMRLRAGKPPLSMLPPSEKRAIILK